MKNEKNEKTKVREGIHWPENSRKKAEGGGGGGRWLSRPSAWWHLPVADPGGGVPGVPWNPLNFAKCAAEKISKISCVHKRTSVRSQSSVQSLSQGAQAVSQCTACACGRSILCSSWPSETISHTQTKHSLCGFTNTR